MNIKAPTADKAAPNIPQRDAYKVEEAAQKLSLSRASIYRLSKAGSIRIVKIAGRTVVPASEIARLLGEAPAAQPLAA
ncbi:MAG: helix-turn-helix domain-containing protein [Rhodoblastus sp.]|nr:MAG: helix-turn-helix domain-containing protein [Rhodoblastus sp.]